MKQRLFVAILAASFWTGYAANAQVTGGGGSGIGSGPPGALPNAGLGSTNKPASNRDNTTLPSSAGLKEQSGVGILSNNSRADDLGVSEAQIPASNSGNGFSDQDVNGRGRMIENSGFGGNPPVGDGLITGSGARLH